MVPNGHAVALLALIVVPAVAIIHSPGWFPRRSALVFMRCVPYLVLGAVFGLLLSTSGAPVSEWLIPAVCTLIAGCFVQKDSVFRTTSWVLFLLSCLLCANALGLRSAGYTSAPTSTVGMSKAVEEAHRRSLAKELQRRYASDDVFPPGPIGRLLPDSQVTTWKRKSVTRLWHTPITGLYEIHGHPGTFWYPGGQIQNAAERLTWERAGNSPDSG